MLTNAPPVSITFCSLASNGNGGLYLSSFGSVVTVTDCVIANNAWAQAMYGTGFGSLRFARNRIVGNTVTSTDNAAVYLNIEGYISGVIIDSNTFDHNVADTALYLNEDSSR